jgi:hypothetical protein
MAQTLTGRLKKVNTLQDNVFEGCPILGAIFTTNILLNITSLQKSILTRV